MKYQNLLTATIIAIAIIIAGMTGRYEIVYDAKSFIALRIDRLSGTVEICFVAPKSSASQYIKNEPKWCKLDLKEQY